jgi:hypothetical protein
VSSSQYRSSWVVSRVRSDIGKSGRRNARSISAVSVSAATVEIRRRTLAMRHMPACPVCRAVHTGDYKHRVDTEVINRNVVCMVLYEQAPHSVHVFMF